MLKFKFISNQKNSNDDDHEKHYDENFIIGNNKIYFSDLFYSWKNSENHQFLVIGKVYGYRDKNKLLKLTSLKDELKLLENPKNISKYEGRFILLKIESNQNISIWSDNYGSVDLYYQISNHDEIIIGSSLDCFSIDKSYKFDQMAYAHALTVYGTRPSKKLTLFEKIKRLGVYEGIQILNNKLILNSREFIPTSSKPEYKINKLDTYADNFLNAIKVRSSSEGNVVFLSSGWDSTSILASLVHLHGKSKVKCIIGKMRYSDRSEVINQIELDKAIKIADYFGVKLHVIDFDYREGAEKIVEESNDLFQKHHFSNMTSINHWRLCKEASKICNEGETIFAGEISDGAHNFGFSQYVTVFHPSSQDFREYSDKMASYLFGPTFYNVLKNNEEKNDPIWNYFVDKKKNLDFDTASKNNYEFNKQFLNSFFISPGRMPLFSLNNNKLITKTGVAEFNSITNKLYFNDIADKLNTDNLYSYYLHLYNSFHWQGSTVATLEYCSDYFGLNCSLPFRDKSIIDFLSGMPESWGRGLDFNNTKYPLKWMLKNRIDYPYKYQEGPHSYIYDINPSFNHLQEILFGSSFKDVFIKALKNDNVVERLSSKYFDLDYISKIVNNYITGKEFIGQEMNDLAILCQMAAIGYKK